jgi:hypothetical protein
MDIGEYHIVLTTEQEYLAHHHPDFSTDKASTSYTERRMAKREGREEAIKSLISVPMPATQKQCCGSGSEI